MSRFFDYTHALTKGMSPSFEQALHLHPPPVPIDVKLAEKQHAAYSELLKRLLPQGCVELPAEAGNPDCCFVEDTAIVVGSTAVLCNPGAPSRKPEVASTRAALEGLQAHGLSLHSLPEPCSLDGGDVLFTGSSIWVGLSRRSNQAAADALSAIFAPAGVPVYAFQVEQALHLKSVVSAFDDRTLVVWDHPVGRHLVDHVREVHAQLAARHDFVYVPDMIAANLLRIGDSVVIQDGFPASEAVLRRLAEDRGVGVHTLCMSELIKADGALTCCSILLRAPAAAAVAAAAP